MTENEAIELHIAENLHRIEVIEEFLRTNSNADDKECKKNIQILTKIDGALQEIQQYRKIGTVDDFLRLNYLKNRYEDETYDFCGEYGTEECELKDRIEQLKKYEEIGTIKECREARKKQIKKKPVKDEYNHDCCPNCGWIVYQDEYGGRYLPHCENCGQAIDWSDIPG